MIVSAATEISGSNAHFEFQIVGGNLLTSILYLLSAFVTRYFLKKNINRCHNVTLINDHGFTFWGLRRDVEYHSDIRSIKIVNRYNIFTAEADRSKSRRMSKSEGSA